MTAREIVTIGCALAMTGSLRYRPAMPVFSRDRSVRQSVVFLISPGFF